MNFKLKLVKIAKETIDYFKKNIAEKDHYKIIKSMSKGCHLTKLTYDEKHIIYNFWKKYYGKRISTKWHEYYYSVNGEFSPRYIPTYLYYSKIYPRLNDQRMMVVYSDKNIIDKLISHVKLPETYVKNINGFFYINGKKSTFNEALKACNNLNDAIIKHSIDTCQGKSVSRFKSENGFIKKMNMSVQELFDSYKKDYIIQEAIQQNEKMASLNPTSLNTIRIMTYHRSNDVVILFTVLRMGRKGSVVDNASAGGLYCGVNIDGYLKKEAYTLTPFSSRECSDNGVVFKDFKIPQFEEMKALVKRMHTDLPYSKIIGWDLAINDNNEIVLIEINAHAPGLFQAATGPAFGDYTEEILNYTLKNE